MVKGNEPRLLRQQTFPESLEAEFGDLLELVRADAKSEPILDTPDEYRAESQRLTSICDALRTLSGLTMVHGSTSEDIVRELSDRSASYDDRADELEPEEREPDDEPESRLSAAFSIDALFSDL